MKSKISTKIVVVSAILFGLFSQNTSGVLAANTTADKLPVISKGSNSVITNVTVEDAGDFVLVPGKVEIFGNPGEEITKKITITNRTNRLVNYSVKVEDFIGSRSEDTPVILLGDDKSPYSFKDNIIPDSRNFSLKFGQQITIPVTVKIPDNQQPGGFYSSVIIASQPTDTGGIAGGARLVSRIGCLFFIRVNGPVKEEGNIEDFTVKEKKSSLMSGGPMTFEILFNNSGSIHLVPYGTISITNLLGKKVAELPVDGYFSLPNSLRYREVRWERDTLFGRYKATLSLNRGYGNLSDEKIVTFWSIPWGYVFIIIGFMSILAVGGRLFKKNFKISRKK